MRQPHPPKNVLDIRTREVHSFSLLHSRVNLNERVTRIALTRPLKVMFCITLSFWFVVSLALAPNNYQSHAAGTSEKDRTQLENQLKELEAEIADYEGTIASYKSQGKTLGNEIKAFQAKISKLNAQVRVVSLSLEKLDQDMIVNQESILTTEEKIARNREAISNSLQYIYEGEQESLVLILLKNPRLTDFSSAMNAALDVQESLTVAVGEMAELKLQLEDEKESLSLKKSDAVAFKAYQEAQRKAIEAAKKEKDALLAATSGQEAKYQALLTVTKKTAAEIRNRLFEFLGGGQMSFGEAYNFAKIAGAATGVRAAFVLAVLDHESALGSNVGRCNYKTAMSPGIPARVGRRDDISVFLKITAELGIDPDSVMVSCPIVADGAFGGAMGAAQFIPTTWALYSARIGAITGNDPPSPWRNGDAIVATSLYLKDALAACVAYTGAARERCAAARYYAGGNWKNYLFTYGDRVVTKANLFQQDIDALNE
ncbi:MAG: lytic murein transglycosylase [bacterium]|nr:lytic murein transglycosylase [bacterium]